jgi:hypothetical protein
MSTAPEPRGFSLVDALVGLALSVTLAAMLATFVAAEHRQLGSTARREARRQELRAAVALITDDLRSAGRRAPAIEYASTPGLCLAEPDRLRLTADLDGDGTTDGAGEDVTYCRCPGSGGRTVHRAYRAVDGGEFMVETIAAEASALGFGYAPRAIEVSLSLAGDPATAADPEGTHVTAALRNAVEAVSCAAGPSCPPASCAEEG